MNGKIPSFAKVNLGLSIGRLREDGFHELRTVYQTIALHDVIQVSIEPGTGIQIHCKDPRVPTDSTNTCWRTAERVVTALKVRGRLVIEIDKRLPVQGGLGGASGNAIATMLGLERAVGKRLSSSERLRIAAEVGSDLSLFLIGGTALGVGRGEEVYPLPDLPAMPCVIALPEIAVSTPQAFGEWDTLISSSSKENEKLINTAPSDRMSLFSRDFSAWLSAASERSDRTAGVSSRAGGRAENLLLDLVRTGIENDFEKVVFPQYPELREVKRVLERAGASYASLSGSGSAVYGLFAWRERAAAAAKKLERSGRRAVLTSTLTRRQYWKRLLVIGY